MDKSTDYEDGYRDGYNVGHKDGVDVGKGPKERAGRLVHDSDGAGYCEWEKRTNARWWSMDAQDDVKDLEDWLYKDVGKQSPTSD